MTEYITVVSVDVADQPKSINSEINGHKLDQHVHENVSSFKTVLSINNQTTTTTISTSQSTSENGSSLSSSEIVPVYRLPGERLGFGLKFQGGTMLNERVQRLFIQSCAANSPASRARASFGLLGEGDEILEIDRQPVTKMTRIECVKCLKDSNVAINLLVCKGEIMVNGKGKNGEVMNGDQPKKRMLPPPPPMVPPRKIIKKVQQREQIPIPVITTKTIIPKETLPVAAELYLNTLDEESNNRNDESDETGSTISTVISNFSSETDLSLLSSTSTSSSSDLTKILTKPFQLIEREFNVHNNNTNNHNNHTINSAISSTVTATTNISSMSIDNMLFNDMEPNDFGGSDKIQIDIKSFGNYENIDIMDNNHEQQLQQKQQEQEQQYENVEIKLPTPRPRSASLTTSQDTTLTSNSPKIISNTIESWLNDSNNTNSSNTINGTKDDKIAPKTASIDNEDNDDDNDENTFELGKIYEPIKFECFAAGDDEEDEKLGPPELLNISEAYFNFSWCGNPSSSLATIGEAEEEFSSMEPQFTTQKCITGPIFIVNSVNDSDSSSDGSDNDKTVESEHSIIKCNPDDREINNNTLYLQQKCNNNYNNNNNNNNICDNTDNGTTDNKLHCEMKSNFILATETLTVPLVPLVKSITVEERTKNLLNSERHFSKMSEPNSDNNIVTVKVPKTLTKELIEHNNNTVMAHETISDSNVTTFKTFEHLIKESDKVVINKEKLIMITIDSNREMCSSTSSSDVSEIQVTNQIEQKVETSKTLITKQIDDETQLNESKKMTSLPTLRASDIQMEQKLLPELSAAAVALERSRLPPVGDEYPPNFSESNGIIVAVEKPVKSGAVGEGTTIDFIKSPPIVTKATAIVAPLVPRKMFHSEEFGDVKPHYKSATLGRHRPIINWRNKDEKSEKSVKDKIAMFSTSTNDISHCLPRTPFKELGSPTPQKNNCFTKSTENIFSSDSLSNNKPKISGNIKKKAMSVENLDDYEEIVEKRSRRDIEYTPIKKPSRNLPPLIIDSKSLTPQATIKMSKAFSVENLIDDFEESSPAPSYNSGTLPRPPPTTAPPSLSRRISFSGYSNNQIEEHRRTSITNILESRRKSMSKLRGLVIPEKVPENETQGEDKVLGLPVIRSTDCDRITSKNVFNRSTSVPQVPTSAPPIRTSSKSSYVPFHSVHSNTDSKNIVKAVPRKLYEKSRSHDSSTFINKAPIVPPMKPPRTSLIISTTNTRSITTDESDTESVMSSRVSTPPISPVAKKSPLVRTFSSETNTSISSNSTLTSGSGSQASCSSNGSNVDMARKVNGKTPASTEVNSSRKSILASSKSRSGRDCLEKSWRDEDSTDGGIDDDERKRTPKAKARSSVVNYKLVNNGDNIVDKVINVATYVEVMTSDSDEKADIPEMPTNGVEMVTMAKATMSVTKTEPVSGTMMSDMAKWVRSESTKTSEKIQMPEVKETMDIKSVSKNSKVLEGMKKLNLSEIRKNFENKSTMSPSVVSPATRTPKEKPPMPSNHNRFSSWDSVASSSSGVSSELLGTGTGTNNSESLQTLQSDFGSFSSFGSSHSLITPQDLQLIIDEADPPLETPEAFVVVLQRETPESSIGITLAGGSDYEAKEITIHRILVNSPADKDGRLKRGDRLLSINGLSMRGLTHRESLSVLKAPRNDVVMVVTRSKSVLKTNSLSKAKRGSLGSLSSLSEKADSMDVDGIAMKKALHASRSLEMDLDTISNDSYQPKEKPAPASRTLERKTKNVDKISIIKDGAGLGFSIDGGFDSPNGNKPLLIKKIFMGGAAERSSNLKVGDEILEINDRPIDHQTRIDVWNMIKAIPQGDAVKLTIKK